MCSGKVNGVVVCTSCGSDTTTKKVESSTSTKTETPAEGPPTTTENKTQEKTTTVNGDQVTTTTTITNEDGSKTEETKTESRGEFCKNNPEDTLCKGTVFSESCTSDPACSGDAATCAIAKATWINKCAVEELKKETAVSNLFDDANPVGNAEFQALSARALNKDGEHDFDLFATFQEKREDYLNFTSSCPAQGLNFEFKGKTYSFDTEFVCQLGEFVRLLMHIAAYMMVARLLSRTFA